MTSVDVRCLTCGEERGFPLRQGLIRRLEEVLCGSLSFKGKLHQQSVCLCLNCKTKLEKIEILISELRAVHRRKQAQRATSTTTTHTVTSNMCGESVDDADNVMEVVEEYEVEDFSRANPNYPNAENTTGVSPVDNQCGCGETLKNIRIGDRHRRAHHGGQHPCHQRGCGLLFDSHTKLVEHGVVHGFTCFQCQTCAAAFLARDKLAQHRHHFHRGATAGLIESFSAAGAETLSTEEGYSAIVQGMSVLSEDPLVQEASDLQAQEEPAPNNHLLVSDYPCPACDSTYLREHRLINHIERYHWKRDPDTNHLSCTFCNLVFTGLKEILPHARYHRDQMLKCPSCTLVFERKSQLTQHSFRAHETAGTYTNRKKEIESLTCSACGAYADTKSLLCYHRLIVHNANTHLIIERPRSRFPCRYCDMSYNEKNDLNKHEKKHLREPLADGDPKYDCLNCGSTFNSEDMLAQHTVAGNCAEAQEPETSNPTDQPWTQSEQDRLEFPCPVCDMTYANETHVMRHIQKAHWCTSNDGTQCKYSCGFCNLTFDDLANIALHARSHRKDLIQCRWCPMVFFMDHQHSQHQMEVHKMQLGNKKPQPAPKEQFKCAQCLTVTDTKSLLSFHTLTEHDTVLCMATRQLAYKCPKCSRAFAQSKLLFSHMQRRHPGTAGYSSYFQCSLCQKKLQTHTGLLVHKSICPVVTGKKTVPRKLRRRARLGTTCYVCGKFFEGSKKALFRDHMMTHTGMWNYECSQCDVKFITEAKLRQHMKRHTLPYLCELCDRGFATSWTLKGHMKTHSKMPAKICEVCNLNFNHKTALQRHQYEVHQIGHYPSGAYEGLRRFKCNLCEQTFNNGMKYRHFSKCHPGIKCSISFLTLLDEAGNPVPAHKQPKPRTRVPYGKKTPAMKTSTAKPRVTVTVKTPVKIETGKRPVQMPVSNQAFDGDLILRAALEAARAPKKGLVLAAKPNQQLEAVPLGSDDDGALRTLLNSTFKKPIKSAYMVKSQGPMTVPIHQLINNGNAIMTKVQKVNVGEGQPMQYIITYKANKPSQNESSQHNPAQNIPAQNSPAQNSPAQNSPAQIIPAQNNPAESNPAQSNPAQSNPAQSNPAQSNPAQSNPAQSKPAQGNAAQSNPAQNKFSQNPKSEAEIYPVLLLNKTV